MAKLIVQFSGGKDSLASLLWVRNNMTKDFITVFCDTGWESDITYKHIQEVKEKLNLNLITLKSKKYDGFLDLAEKKKRFPSTKERFCTDELKSKPMIDYILDDVNDHCLIVQGIRKAESHARSKMNAQCTQFKYYFEPYGIAGNGKPKFHTYRKKDVIAFRKKFADDVIRPVFDWSGQQVIDYILNNGLEPNPLYKMGMKRVGCFPCIMSNHIEIRNLIKNFPERINYLTECEVKITRTFFPPDYTPRYACENRKYPSVPDVVKYIQYKNATGDLFAETNETSCMSFYGLCE
jgi:3'-phosphoadenosine 5'-phosphosulfate sulfotransferase (PAPS reductase)/FAD synthetase